MGRKIIDQLFQSQPDSSRVEENQFVSIKDWKALVSRLDHTQAQVHSCNEKMSLMYSKVMYWLSCVRKKLEVVSKTQEETDVETKKLFKQLEEKVMNWVQPEQRKEDQRRVMDLMQRHSQFIQSYDKQIDSVKKTLSKNEYQLYQLLEQIRTLRVEMDILNRHQTSASSLPSSHLNREFSDLNV